MTMSEEFQFRGLEPLKDAPVATGPAIAAVALSLAIQYYNIATVQDGTLYQQYKLEGRNLESLHLDMVFETAIKMEAHLLGASDRVAKLVVDAISRAVEEDGTEDE